MVKWLTSQVRHHCLNCFSKITKKQVKIIACCKEGHIQRKKTSDINVNGLKDCPFCDVSAESKPADTSSIGNDVPTSIIDNSAVPDDAHQSQPVLTEKKESNKSCTENANRTDTMPANAHQS
ncbi:hypothetical protein BDQ17DRAFT_1338377 [Cyathus striatus]|nr:hypothetical protein BDQ17DRAFT_1338377 [Cyathus striatus]